MQRGKLRSLVVCLHQGQGITCSGALAAPKLREASLAKGRPPSTSLDIVELVAASLSQASRSFKQLFLGEGLGKQGNFSERQR